MYRNNLATMWLRRHKTTGDRTALEQAVHHASQALALCADDDPGRPMYANTVAMSLLTRWERSRREIDLLRAVNLGRIAAAADPDSDLDLVGHLSNLGAAMMVNAIHFGDNRLLDEAVEVLERALRLSQPGHHAYGSVLLNLGQVLVTRGRAEDSERGRDLLRRSAAHPQLRQEDAIAAARLWAGHAAETGDWGEAAQTLTGAVQRLADLPGHRLERSDHERLLARVAGLATDAAAASLNNEDSAGAVASLEAGQGILLSRAFRHDQTTARLHDYDSEVADRFQRASTALSAIGPAQDFIP